MTQSDANCSPRQIPFGHWRQTASILETTEVELEDFAGKVDILDAMQSRK